MMLVLARGAGVGVLKLFLGYKGMAVHDRRRLGGREGFEEDGFTRCQGGFLGEDIELNRSDWMGYCWCQRGADRW